MSADEPRVWFNGDTVPAGVYVLTEDGEVDQLDEDEDEEARNHDNGPLVEVVLPDYDAAVDAALTSARCTHRLNDRGGCKYRCGLDRADAA